MYIGVAILLEDDAVDVGRARLALPERRGRTDCADTCYSPSRGWILATYVLGSAIASEAVLENVALAECFLASKAGASLRVHETDHGCDRDLGRYV